MRARIQFALLGAALLAALAVAATAIISPPARSAVRAPASAAPVRLWKTRDLTGSVQIRGEVPLSVSAGKALYVRPLPANWKVTLNFGFPITATASLNKLIMQEARSHHYITRSQLYNRYSPPQQQISALTKWLTQHGLRVTHIGADRLSLGISATAGQVQRALHVKLNEYIRPAYTFDGIKVPAYAFYANTTNPTVPARFGLQTISGLTSVDRFYTDVQVAYAHGHDGNLAVDSPARSAPVSAVRGGGYYPSDIRSMYDVNGYDASGETLGFTLWGAGETQGAMNLFASTTGDQLITVLPACTATGSPTTPSSCSKVQVGADQLMTILENGNANNDYAGNDETGLDIEQAHGIATHAGMKYYDGDCETSPPAGSGLNDTGCNGSDVGLEDAVEDAANDPTLHTVSDSWLYGGDPEWGVADPFVTATQNSFMIAAAAGTTFYFSTGDSGTYQSGYPADSPYVVGVGGTSLFSTATVSQQGTEQLSTETTWTDGGSWCSNIFARPWWQTGPGVTANADCPDGRAVPDVSAIADTSTPVYEAYSTFSSCGGPPTGISCTGGSVGGTSVSAPEWSGLTADLESFVAAQSYPGATPAVGFTAPIIYQLGNSDQNGYFRDVLCGNDADPAGSPDGAASVQGWDQATGWGAPDFVHFATGYAMALGATGLTTPSSLSEEYSWACAKTPSNSAVQSLAFPSSSIGYAVGATGTSWYSLASGGAGPSPIPSGAWGPVDEIYKSTDGGSTWLPSNADMTSIACTSSTTCVEVGDGGQIRFTSDSGASWSDVASGFDKGLTQVVCPSSSVCYAAGDRGFVLKSTDGGQTFTYLSSTDGNPIYGLFCVSTTTCYATDDYAHIIKTTDGGGTWSWQTTPVTTPGVDVPGSGGPNPFAGLYGISCADTAGQDCVAVGGFPPTGTTAPIVATSNGGQSWTSDNVTAPAGDWLAAVTCLPSTTTCYAVGDGGDIEKTTDMVNWTQMASATSEMLDDITCSSTTSCFAVGQDGTVDTLNGVTWTSTSGLAGGLFLAGASCPQASGCYAVGKEGITIAVTPSTAGWSTLAGGGIAAQMNSISCPSTSDCVAVGDAAGGAGSVESTADGGQQWLAQTVPTNRNLYGVSCASTTACVAVGDHGAALYSNAAGVWSAASSGTTNPLRAVSCLGSDCIAVGDGGTIVGSTDGGATWTPQASNTAAGLDAISCPAAGDCIATGAIPFVNSDSTVLVTTNDGASWTPENSATTQELFAIACLDTSNCFAGGADGTVVTTTDGGAAWTQEGDPLSGPVDALNASASPADQISAVACSPSECAMGTGSAGDVMVSPLLTVTVVGTQSSPTQAGISDVPANDPSISYSPSSEAPDVTGTLTCSAANTASPEGTYPVSDCSGLAADGYSVVYDYAASSYTVIYPPTSTSTTTTTSTSTSSSSSGSSSSSSSSSSSTTTTTSTADTTSTTTATSTTTTSTSSPTTTTSRTASTATTTGTVSTGTLPPLLSLSTAANAVSFGAFAPGVTDTYSATVGATITSTVPSVALTAADLSSTFPGHLVDGAVGGPYELAQGLEAAASASPAAAATATFSELTAEPAALLSVSGPVSGESVAVTFRQPVAATDPLHPGSYVKTIALTLSTGTA